MSGASGDGPQRRRLGAIHVLSPAAGPVLDVGAAVGDRRPGEREVGVEHDRVLEHLEGELHVPRRAPAGVAAAPQVEVVGLEVLGRLGGELRLLLGRELDAQRLGDLVGDLVLHLEDVGHLAVVALRPDREAGRRVHELGADPQPVPGAAQAPFEGVAGRELPADVRRGRLLVAEREHRGARKDVQAVDLRQVGQDVLGDAVPQVLVFLDSREVFEIEHRDRALRALARRFRVGERGRARPAPFELAPQAEEVGLQLRGGLVAEAAVLLERLLEDRPERRGHRRVRFRERPGIAVQDGVEDDGLGVPLEGPVAGGHLVEHRAEREEVRARVGRQPARLLGRHVVDRAEDGPGRRQIRRSRGRRGRSRLADRRAWALELRQAEIEELHLAARRHHHVHRLQVAVDDAFRVRRLERVGHLDPEIEELPDFHRLPREPRRERFAFDELHHDERLPVVLLDGVHGTDAGMVQGRGRSRLALEPLQCRRVLRELRREELHRDAPPEPRVFRLEHHAHAAGAELAQDPVVRNHCSEQLLLLEASPFGPAPPLRPGAGSFARTLPYLAAPGLRGSLYDWTKVQRGVRQMIAHGTPLDGARLDPGDVVVAARRTPRSEAFASDNATQAPIGSAHF